MEWLSIQDLLYISVYSLVVCNIFIFWYVVSGMATLAEPFCEGHTKLRYLANNYVYKSLFVSCVLTAAFLHVSNNAIHAYVFVVSTLMITSFVLLIIAYGVFVVTRAFSKNVIEEQHEKNMCSVDPDIVIK